MAKVTCIDTDTLKNLGGLMGDKAIIAATMFLGLEGDEYESVYTISVCDHVGHKNGIDGMTSEEYATWSARYGGCAEALFEGYRPFGGNTFTYMPEFYRFGDLVNVRIAPDGDKGQFDYSNAVDPYLSAELNEGTGELEFTIKESADGAYFTATFPSGTVVNGEAVESYCPYELQDSYDEFNLVKYPDGTIVSEPSITVFDPMV